MEEGSTNPHEFLPDVLKPILGQPSSGKMLDILASLSFKKEGQYFLNQTVYVDDYTFIKCRFDNCKLVTYKGTFNFQHCVIDSSTIIYYGNEAYKIATLFNATTANRRLYPNFDVKLNNDGTFSLE